MSSRSPAPPARATLVGAALLALAACAGTQLTDPTAAAQLAAKSSGGGGGGGGGNTPTPPPAAAPMTGTWTGENRWGPGVGDARRWTLTLTQSGAAFTGRLRTEVATSTGALVEGEGNITVNGTLAGTDVTFTMRPKRGGSASTFVGTLAADGRSMRGVNWVPTVPRSILGGAFTLAKQ